MDGRNGGGRRRKQSPIPPPRTTPPDPPPPPAPVEPGPGPVELSVMADLERLGHLDSGVRGSLREMALKLARAFDHCQSDDIAALAKLNSELRQTLNRLTGVDGNDSERWEALIRALSTPVRDAAQPGAGDAGPPRCSSCGGAA